MAGLEADISHFKQPLPVSPLDMTKNIAATRSAVQQNISNDTKIASDKLQLMATQFQLMNNELANLADNPNITKDQAASHMARFSKTLNLPPAATTHMMEELTAAQPKQLPNGTMLSPVQNWAMFAQRRGMETMQKYGVQFGTNQDQTDGATNYQGVRASPEKGGGFTPGTQSAVQPPPTQPMVDTNPLVNGKPNPKYLEPGIMGPAAAPGFAPARGLPVAPPEPMAAAPMPLPRPRPAGLPVEPIAAPAPVSGASGPSVQTGFDFDQRFAGDRRISTGAAPGVAEAVKTVREQSGKDYATALTRAGNIQADIQPDMAVLDIVKGKAPGDFGTGTPALNEVKKWAVTWLKDVDPKLINDSSDYDTVRKYLVQGARAAGNTGTNDQLAAAFEGSPNVTMNTATIENIVKTRVALKKMEAAQALMFEQTGLPDGEFSKWKAKNQNNFDPRAFGWDMMSNEAREKLMKRLTPKEYQKLETSVQFAADAKLIENPKRTR